MATLKHPPKQKPRGQTAKAKFLDHLNLSTTQIYAETSIQALGDNYLRAWAAITAPGSIPDRRYFAEISTFARLRPDTLFYQRGQASGDNNNGGICR